MANIIKSTITRNISLVKCFLFFLFPFFTSCIAYFNLKKGWAYFAIAIFYLLFGLSFNPVNESADSYRYAEEFQSFCINPESNYIYALETYFGNGGSEQGEIKDIYIYTMYYISSQIGGNNVHILFLLFSVVFTFFALKCLSFITQNRNYSNCLPMLILMFLFIYSNSIFNINGVRFWTASWVAVYLIFKILIDRRVWAIAFLPVLPLIHASFILFIVFFFLSYLFKSKVSLFSIVYIISFFFGEIGLHIIDSVRDYLPLYIQNMIWSYTESDWANSKMDGTAGQQEALYARILMALPRYYELGLLLLVSFRRKEIASSLLGFSLIYFSLVNFCIIIPSISRFYLVGYPMIIYLWVNNFKVLKRYVKYIYLAPFIYSYSVFRWVRNILSITDFTLYFSNLFHIVSRNLITSK